MPERTPTNRLGKAVADPQQVPLQARLRTLIFLAAAEGDLPAAADLLRDLAEVDPGAAEIIRAGLRMAGMNPTAGEDGQRPVHVGDSQPAPTRTPEEPTMDTTADPARDTRVEKLVARSVHAPARHAEKVARDTIHEVEIAGLVVLDLDDPALTERVARVLDSAGPGADELTAVVLAALRSDGGDTGQSRAVLRTAIARWVNSRSRASAEGDVPVVTDHTGDDHG